MTRASETSQISSMPDRLRDPTSHHSRDRSGSLPSPRGARPIRARYSSTAWDLAFGQVRAEVRRGPAGRLRAEVWVNALLNDEPDEDEPSTAMSGNIMSLTEERVKLTRRLVELIDRSHRTWKRYPVLAALVASSGPDPEALGEAYLQHLRRDLERASAPRAVPPKLPGSIVALRAAEGYSEGA